MGFNFMFSVMPVLMMVFFIFVFCIIISSFVKGAKQKRKDDQSPRLTVAATVVTKRTQVGTSHHHHHTGSGNMHSHTNYHTKYFATFQVESGDRMELAVADYEYGMLVEGDRGNLTFQGSRFLGFQRT